jgi:outer membrane protein assembly factor BamB
MKFQRRRLLPAAAAMLAVLFVVIGNGGSANAGLVSPGQAPQVSGTSATEWPLHNYDLANTRDVAHSPINSANVSSLTVKWRMPLTAAGPFGAFAANPTVVDGVIYLQDLNSNVYAVRRGNGALIWKHTFDVPNLGPNGVVHGWGMVFGGTTTDAFALDAGTGAVLWSRRLTRTDGEGIDLAPQLAGNTVVISTVPGSLAGYLPGGMGIVYGLDPTTGATKWSFNTVKDGDLWGHPEINSGGGVWYPPAVDDQGRVFFGTGNPAPFPGVPGYPNGSSRPGDNLYTNSLVALDGRTGRLLWYNQVVPHDIRDYDLAVSPIIAYLSIRGVRTEVLLTAGKNGYAYAFRATDGQMIWQRPVGTHQNDVGPLPDTPVPVMPGMGGGVVTPIAFADGRLFVPWVDAASQESSTTITFPDVTNGTGGLTAIDATTGKPRWERQLPRIVLGAATVANDVVFTSTFDGHIYAFDTRSGKTLWTATARAGINSFPAVAGDMLLVGAGVPGFFPNPQPELIAYELSG